MTVVIQTTLRHSKGRYYLSAQLQKAEEIRIVPLMPSYRRRGGGGSAQLLLQPDLLGLLQLRACRGVIEQLGVQYQAEDSTHLRQ